MKHLFLILSALLCPAVVQAQTIGVEFADIPVGTQFHYETIGGGGYQFASVYVGKKGAHHVMDVYSIENGKLGRNPINRRYFSETGLLVRSETLSLDKIVEYVPFDCRRSTARSCEHVRKVTNKKTGKVKTAVTHKFKSRLSGKKLTVTSFFTNGDQSKTHYTFDPRGIYTNVHIPDGDLSQGEKLVREVTP